MALAEGPPPSGPPAPVHMGRSTSEGGIPIFGPDMVNIIDKPAKNLDGLEPRFDTLWFGKLKMMIQGETWVIDNFLNFGAEGQTYTLINLANGRTKAAKFCSHEKSREIDIIQQLPVALVEHPNLIKYEMILKDVGSILPPAKHVIVMEIVPNGELFDFIASPEKIVQGKPVSEGTSRRFLHDIISGMAECYRFGVTHRDLKPENLMLNESGRIKIIDMGHAKQAPGAAAAGAGASGLLMPGGPPPPGGPPMPGMGPMPGGPGGPPGGPPMPGGPASLMPGGPMPAAVPLEKATTSNPYGTPAFNAPEVTKGVKYDCEASDVWSVGVIAFTLHAKLPAFQQGGGVAKWSEVGGPGNETFWNKIIKCGFYRTFPQDLRDFINTLWCITPSERPTFDQMIKACRGDEEVLRQFPGLAWLAKPVNELPEFIQELMDTNPKIKLDIDGADGAVAIGKK